MKPTLQKCYEKMQMIKNNPDQLVLMVGRENGSPCVVLAIQNGQTVEEVTPIAIVLDEGRMNTVAPDWQKSIDLQPILEEAAKKDLRTSVQDFNVQNDLIDQHFAQASF